jgi:hypothetical protein
MKRLLIFLSFLICLSLACALPFTGSTPQDQALLPAGSVLFQDDFSNRDSGFNHSMTAQGIIDYDSGGYRILVNDLNTNFWATPLKDFSNVRMEVDVGKIGGPDENRIGLLCRFSTAVIDANTTYSNYYFFIITSDGFYGVGLYFNGQAILLGQNELKASEAVKTGLAVNHLRADCASNTLSFYVNGYQVASVQDGSLQSGDVGLLAGTFIQPGVDIIFDNFVVVKP